MMWDKLDTYVAEKTRDEYAARLRRTYHQPILPERIFSALRATLGQLWQTLIPAWSGRLPRPRPFQPGERVNGGMIDELS